MTPSPPAATVRLHHRILADLDEMEATARRRDDLARRAASVSAWSVGQQLEHLVLSDRTILDALQRYDEAAPAAGGRPSLRGRFVLWTGFIPRGRGKAPSATRPGEVDPETLPGACAAIHRRFEEMAARLPTLAAASGTVAHPALGHFTPSQWLRFVHIHHRHHLKIVRDILRAA